MTESNIRKTDQNGLELYFHIPFCLQKCHYCDFLSGPAANETMEAYMTALLRETSGRSKEAAGYQVVSIFIGGGTPSVVDVIWITRLMDLVNRKYTLDPGAEITIEVNPGTVDREKLLSYRKAGINRLSIGMQSASETLLKRLGRIHTFGQFLDTYHWAGEAGFHNINVDVMSALPGQNMDIWLDTLHQILALEPLPQHISAYSLIVEEGTEFAREEQEGKLELPSEDCERQMYELTRAILASGGYHRYEISNYALDGYDCRHNCGYWSRIPYLGLGTGAASLLEETRFSNGRDLNAYLADPLGVREKLQKLTEKEQMEEFMFLGLRLIQGVDKQEFQDRYGVPMQMVYGEVIRRNKADGLIHESDKRIWLTDKGLDLSNYVMAQFLL